MRSFGGVMTLVMLTVATSGCLRKETIHTLHLGTGGDVEWQVDESGVRSDAEGDAGRLEEERGYILPALIGAHPVAQGLQALGPDIPVRTIVLREEVPFRVITTARFSRLDRAFERLFAACGLDASVTLSNDGEVTRLQMRIDSRKSVELRDAPALHLLEDLGDFRFVLTGGRFIAGGGFDVPDRSRAILSREAIGALSAALDTRQPIELVLAWTTAR